MGSYRGRKFFLKAGVLFLVGSMLLPFSSQSFDTHAHFDSMHATQVYQARSFIWSFLYVSVRIPTGQLHPDAWMHIGPLVVFFIDYWSIFWRAPSAHNIFISLLAVFGLQLALIVLGFIALKRGGGILLTDLLFAGAVSLAVLYLCVHAGLPFLGTPSFGFGLSIAAILFILVAKTRKKWA